MLHLTAMFDEKIKFYTVSVSIRPKEYNIVLILISLVTWLFSWFRIWNTDLFKVAHLILISQDTSLSRDGFAYSHVKQLTICL